jgi:hypothetical protein
MAALSAELRAWLQPGLAGVIAVADDGGRPQIVRCWAVRARGEDRVEVYVQRAVAATLLAIVGEGRRAAINLVEVASYRSRTIKGHLTPWHGPLDQALVDASIAAQGQAFASVGLPVGGAERMLSYGGCREMAALVMHADSVFDQSPRPGAGAAL